MYLNTLKPAKGSKKAVRRVGRGIGSGRGKTCGLGHKGQRARSGGYHRVGFEGGQMPLQRRLPKFGFRSRMAEKTEEIRLTQLAKLDAAVIDFELLQAEGLVSHIAERVKVFKDGKIDKAFTVKGLRLTAGAKAAILAAGGKVEA